MDGNTISNPEFVCNVCSNRQNLKRCGICKCTYYCSRQHQMDDWNNHKQKCQLLAKRLIQSSDLKSGTHSQNIDADKVNEKDKHNNLSKLSDSTAHDQKDNNHSLNENANRNDSESEASSATCTNNIADTAQDEDGIPFDTRPFTEQTFIKMSTETGAVEVAKTAVQKMNEHGFCVIDGLFTNSQIKRAIADINKCSSNGLLQSGKLSGGITSGDENKQIINSGIRSDQIMWIEGTEGHLPGATYIVSKMDAILWEFNQFLNNKYFINGRTKAMLACYPGNGSFYRRHVDNPHGDGRVVTCILYLNRGWNVQADGGLLRILPAGSDNHIDISPVANRLLFFWSDKRNPHEVQPAFKTRHAITVWYMDQEERRQAKLKQQGEMETVKGEYVLQERHNRVIERDDVSKKIEDEASKAVASLSLDELKALSSMVAGQQDADAILAEVGIAANIRTKLLHRIKELDA